MVGSVKLTQTLKSCNNKRVASLDGHAIADRRSHVTHNLMQKGGSFTLSKLAGDG